MNCQCIECVGDFPEPTFAELVDEAYERAKSSTIFTPTRAEIERELDKVVLMLANMPRADALAFVRATHRGADTHDVYVSEQLKTYIGF